MNIEALVYGTYLLAALGAAAVWLAMPGVQYARRTPPILIGLAAMVGLMSIIGHRYGGDTGDNMIFAVLASLSLIAAVRVITHPKPVYSALYFVLVALASVGMIVMVGAEFLGVALVIVYAGAILVTYVFVIMLAQQSNDDAEAHTPGSPLDYDGQAREPTLAVCAGFGLMAALAGLILRQPWNGSASLQTTLDGNVRDIGVLLFSKYAISVELAGVLLLVAIVGAIALARRPIDVDVTRARPDEPAPGEVGRHVKPF